MNSPAQSLTLAIITPTAEVLNTPVSYVNVPGEVGDFGVLPGHMPLISTLRPGAELTATLPNGTTTRYTLAGGFAEVSPTTVSILTEAATAV